MSNTAKQQRSKHLLEFHYRAESGKGAVAQRLLQPRRSQTQFPTASPDRTGRDRSPKPWKAASSQSTIEQGCREKQCPKFPSGSPSQNLGVVVEGQALGFISSLTFVKFLATTVGSGGERKNHKRAMTLEKPNSTVVIYCFSTRS